MDFFAAMTNEIKIAKIGKTEKSENAIGFFWRFGTRVYQISWLHFRTLLSVVSNVPNWYVQEASREMRRVQLCATSTL